MINKLVVDNVNITLNESTILPFTYTFSMAGVHNVKIGLDNTNEICAFAFKDCEDLSKVKHIPENITMIKRSAFENCTKLSSFNVPSTIQYIGANVFDGCLNLKEINFESSVPPVFNSILDDTTNCYIPDGSKYIEINKEDIPDYYNNNKNAVFYKKSDNLGGYGFEEVDFDVLDLSEDGPQYYIDNWVNVHNHYNTIEERFRVRPTSIDFVDGDITVTDYVDPFNPGDTGTIFDYKILPEDTTNKNVYLYSSNEKILTVNQNGTFKVADNIKNKTTVYIYICTEPYYDGTYSSARIRLTINASPEPLEEIDTEYISDESGDIQIINTQD